jgi:hypothetical protein
LLDRFPDDCAAGAEASAQFFLRGKAFSWNKLSFEDLLLENVDHFGTAMHDEELSNIGGRGWLGD